MAGMFVGGVGAAAGATIVIGGAAVLVTTSAIAITWNVLTQGHLTLAVSNEGSSSGKENTSDEGKGESGSSELENVYNSIKESPNYPEGFEPRRNGITRNTVKNKGLLEKLREIESGTWKKVYKDGYDINGNEISIHYFQSESGKVFDVKVKPGWSN